MKRARIREAGADLAPYLTQWRRLAEAYEVLVSFRPPSGGRDIGARPRRKKRAERAVRVDRTLQK